MVSTRNASTGGSGAVGVSIARPRDDDENDRRAAPQQQREPGETSGSSAANHSMKREPEDGTIQEGDAKKRKVSHGTPAGVKEEGEQERRNSVEQGRASNGAQQAAAKREDGAEAEDEEEQGQVDASPPPPAPPNVAPPTAASLKLVHVLQQALHQDWHHNVFPFEEYVRQEQGLRLDHGECSSVSSYTSVSILLTLTPTITESSICRTFLATGSCPLGTACPQRHVPLFQPPQSSASHNRDGQKRTVCKHWLRGLCKKGDGCDYLHEYDMRTMPECRFYATFGYCDAAAGGERECLYLHRDAKTKRRECELYRRGFCPKGPACAKKHVRRILCPRYVAGFCPLGDKCAMGHAKLSRPSAESRRSSPVRTVRPLTAAEAFAPTQYQLQQQEIQQQRAAAGFGPRGGGGGMNDGRASGANADAMRGRAPVVGARQWGGQPLPGQDDGTPQAGSAEAAAQQQQMALPGLGGADAGQARQGGDSGSFDPFAAGGALPGSAEAVHQALLRHCLASAAKLLRRSTSNKLRRPLATMAAVVAGTTTAGTRSAAALRDAVAAAAGRAVEGGRT